MEIIKGMETNNLLNLQLAELRQRLDHAEADRQELQDELRQEREARQKLEMMIKELKLQIVKSSKTTKE